MSQILDLMPQSTVVSYSQMVQQLTHESSEKAHDSQVTVILSLWAKQQLPAPAGTPSFLNRLGPMGIRWPWLCHWQT